MGPKFTLGALRPLVEKFLYLKRAHYHNLIVFLISTF